MGQANEKVYDHTKFLNEITSDKKLSSGEIERQFKIFQEDYPKGYMTKGEFVEYYCQKSRKFGSKRKEMVKIAKHIFKIMNTDGDDKLDFREYISVVALRCQGSLDEKLAWAYKLYDADNNGDVSIDEVINMIKSVQGLTLKKKSEMLQEKEIRQIFTRADDDGDGTLSLEEFIKRFKTSRRLMRIVTEYNQSMNQ